MTQIHIKDIPSVNDVSFKKYGAIIKNLHIVASKNIIASMKLPLEGNEYQASILDLEYTPEYNYIKTHIFGNRDIQAGACNGWRNSLNALEFHKSSEVILAITDLVLILGLPQHLKKNNTYETIHVECFFLTQYTAVELYPRILHFAPCRVNKDGFRSGIILPRGTNDMLSDTTPSSYLFRQDKWILAHKDAHWLIAQGAKNLLIGENIEIIH